MELRTGVFYGEKELFLTRDIHHIKAESISLSRLYVRMFTYLGDCKAKDGQMIFRDPYIHTRLNLLHLAFICVTSRSRILALGNPILSNEKTGFL